MNSNVLGNKIRRLRQELNPPMTQTVLALQMSETQATVSKWETGYRRPPIEKLARLAKVLGTSVDYLLSLDEELAS